MKKKKYKVLIRAEGKGNNAYPYHIIRSLQRKYYVVCYDYIPSPQPQTLGQVYAVTSPETVRPSGFFANLDFVRDIIAEGETV